MSSPDTLPLPEDWSTLTAEDMDRIFGTQWHQTIGRMMQEVADSVDSIEDEPRESAA
jgi:hypothetical protein